LGEEYWNAGESNDATYDDACAATKIVLNAGETRYLRIAMNGIDRAPDFTYLPYSLPIDLSDDGDRVVGLYGPFQSPYWIWNKQHGMENIDGVGFIGAVSGDGRVVGGTLTKLVDTEYGPVDQERAAIWTRSGGWKKIADEKLQGCDIFQTSVFDVNRDGSAAVGLAFEDCSHVMRSSGRQKPACASSARPAKARRGLMPSRAMATWVAGKRSRTWRMRVGRSGKAASRCC
jgi:hypothetical protein